MINELYRNGSGYVDPTAAKAIKNYIKECETMKFKRGEIYEYSMKSGTQTKHGHALIVSGEISKTDKFINLIVLSDRKPYHDYLFTNDTIDAAKTCAKITVNGNTMYADGRMLAYGEFQRFGRKIAEASDNDMKTVDRCLRYALGLSADGEGEQTEPQAEKETNDAEITRNEMKAFRAEAEQLANLFSEFSVNVRRLLYGSAEQ